MHLERNLNPAISKLYLTSGVIMLVIALAVALIGGRVQGLAQHGSLIIAVLAISGVAGIVSGVLHH